MRHDLAYLAGYCATPPGGGDWENFGALCVVLLIAACMAFFD